ncbi:MAG: hypothetical protein ACP5RY_06915, partial [Thermoplasmata archaeon]
YVTFFCNIREVSFFAYKFYICGEVKFDDLDIVEQYPWEASGMVKIIATIHSDFPGLVIGINRGFELIDNLSAYVNFVVYEDFGTYYNFTTSSYQFLNGTELLELQNITEYIKSLGLPVLGLGYAPQNCDYYANFDSRLGKELGVPVYTGNWNLSELYMPCSHTYYIFQEVTPPTAIAGGFPFQRPVLPFWVLI